MNPVRPHNHVTEAIAANRRAMLRGSSQMPEVSLSLVEWLEAQFPPRCLLKDEQVEDHLRYAGKVEIVQMIRAKYKEQADWTAEDHDDLLPEDYEHL